MPSEKNTQIVNDLSTKLSQSSALLLIDYRGLTHKQLEELRNILDKTSSILQVTKNRLLKIGLENNKNYSPFIDKILTFLNGPTATIFVSGEVVSSVKSLYDYIDRLELPIVKVAIIDNKLTRADEVEKISKLPSYQELMAILIGQILSPLYSLTYILNAKTRELTYAFKAIQSKKGGDRSGEN